MNGFLIGLSTGLAIINFLIGNALMASFNLLAALVGVAVLVGEGEHE